MNITFHQPKHVVQVIHNNHWYGTQQHTAAHRHELLRWPSSIPALSGYATKDTVFLNETIEQHHLAFAQSDMLIMTDYTLASVDRPAPHRVQQRGGWYTVLRDMHRLHRYAVFTLVVADSVVQLAFDYSGNAFSIGVPHRGDFPLGPLHQHHPVRVSVNGKSDFSMTGRCARTFTLFD